MTKANLNSSIQNEPIRILHAVPSLGYANGVAGVVMNWYREIDKSKVQFDFLVCYNRDKTFDDEIKKLGGRVYNLPAPTKRPLAFVKSAYKAFKQSNYAALHSHVTQYNFFFFPMARLFGIKKIIMHSHNPKYSDNKIKAVFAGLMLSCVKWMADLKAACSEKAGDFVFGKNADYILINNAVDCKKFAFNPLKRSEIRAKLGLSDDNFLVGHIGRFCEQKNQTFLLDIFNIIQKRNKNARLIMAGMGPLEQATKDKVKMLGLDEKVIFLGVYDKPADLYQAMDVFLLPSLYEGLPVVGIEAQAAGLPCFFSDRITRKTALFNSWFLPIEDASCWADFALEKYVSFKRENTCRLIEEAGFGIKGVVSKIAALYGLK